MSRLKLQHVFLCFTIFYCVLWSVFVFSEPMKGENAEPGRIVIESQTMEMDNQLKLVTFLGDVKAKRDDFVIDCDKMLVYYESMPSTEETRESKTKINKIVATGNVIINRAEGEKATAEEATYHQKDDRLVLTGSPTVTRGDDLVKGDRITIFLSDDRSVVVEGSESQKVSVTISPGSE